jgi:nucleotide-binding universal stress UspA family protein
MNWRLIHVNGPVICGIEDEAGAGVADVARELAERYESPLLYVHVLAEDGEMEQAVRMLRNAVPGSGELAIERSRHPADHLVELAEQRGASFLVVGNHGPRSSLLGSISADVSRRAPCPVIVVSPAAEAEAPGSEAPSDESEVEGGIVRFNVRSAARKVA